MKLEVKGQVFPKVWEIAERVKELREERKIVNIGSGTAGFTVYEVTLPEGTKKEGVFFITPQGIRIYYFPGNQYEIGYLISELDEDRLVKRVFKK
ncbi:MAG: hypothetical protein L0Y68_00795 [Candidatus Dadabacteria bacterium]|nr:hypothetical protein [Candidatus Dadabacteria bacterium]